MNAVAIISFMFFLSSMTFCMEIDVSHVEKYKNPALLLEKNGKYLKKLVAIETGGNFSPELLKVEEILKTFFDTNSPDTLKDMYDCKTLKLGRLLSQRSNYREILSEAIEHDNPEKLQTIMDENPYMLNAYDNDGEKNVLHNLVTRGNEHCVERLLQLKANPNSITGDKNHYSPLHLANTRATMEMLVKNGANVHGKDTKGRTPLFNQTLTVDEMAVLIAHGARVNERDNKEDSPLHKAIKRNNFSECVDFLLSAGADPESRNGEGKTPFSLACEHEEDWPVFEKYGYLFFPAILVKNPFMLLKNEAYCLKKLADTPIGSDEWKCVEKNLQKLFLHIDRKIDRKEGIGCSFSAMNGVLVTSKGCFFKNASVSDCDEVFGREIMAYARKIVKKRAGIQSDLRHATNGDGDEKELIKILKDHTVSRSLQHEILVRCMNAHNMQFLKICLENKFNPNGNDSGLSLVHYAIQARNPEAVELLMEYNAELVPYYRENQTPLKCAIYFNAACFNAWKRALKKRFGVLLRGEHNCYLLKNILETHIINVNEQDDDKNAPLHYVAKLSCEDCAELLIKHGADVNVRDRQGHRPIHYALNNNKTNLITLFIRAGVPVNRACCQKAGFNVLRWALEGHYYELVNFLVGSGAVVDLDMLDVCDNKHINEILHNFYQHQNCYRCTMHPDDMRDTPCSNANEHRMTFICRKCYQQVRECPICKGTLGSYD